MENQLLSVSAKITGDDMICKTLTSFDGELYIVATTATTYFFEEKMQNQYRKRKVDYDVPSDMPTLPAEYYQTDSIYREEIEKIFYKRWLMVCREEEISDPGEFLTVDVGDENIILVRCDKGEVRAHFNVCRHRGTRMCTEDRGRFDAGVIRCPYHAWQYNFNGSVNAAPLMKEQPGFQKEDFPLFPAHVGIWGGFVFINLAENPVPFEEDLAVLIKKFEPWRMAELRIAHKIEYTLNCNWKLILQNYQECYHCPGVHPMLNRWTPFRSASHDSIEGLAIGGYMELEKGRGSMTMDGDAAGPPVCDVSGEDLQRVYYYSIFPNFLLTPHPDFVMYHRIRPLAIDCIQNDCFFLLHPDVIADPTKMERFQSAVSFWDLTNRQDWQVCEQMQEGLKSQRFRQGVYAPQEDILYGMDNQFLILLGHNRDDSQE